jgi:hypothetical protein
LKFAESSVVPPIIYIIMRYDCYNVITTVFNGNTGFMCAEAPRSSILEVRALVHSISDMADCGAVVPSSSGATDKDNAATETRTQLPHLEEFYVKHPAPSSQPDPRTVEMIKYYQQARKEHDFQLIEVRSGAVSSQYVQCSANVSFPVCDAAEYTKQQGIRQPVYS